MNDSTSDATAQTGSGCVVFLVDETPAMDTRVAEGRKSKADCIATALNSLLNRLGAGADLDLAVVGYRGNEQDGADVGCRWGGPLAGETFVHAGRLARAPVTIEQRVRRIPEPGGVGVAGEETVQFPIWYVPRLGGAAQPEPAYAYARELLATRTAVSKPPLVVSCVGELSPGQEFSTLVNELLQEQFPGGPPLVFHAHLSSSAQVPPTLYPSANAHLAPGAQQQVFECTSVLPGPLAESLKQLQVTVNPGARGMIYNAKMVDLIRFFSLVKAYEHYQPPAVTAVAKPQANGPRKTDAI